MSRGDLWLHQPIPAYTKDRLTALHPISERWFGGTETADVRAVRNNSGQRDRTFWKRVVILWQPMASVGSLLTPEDVLRGLREIFLPLNYLFNGQLERGDETVIRPSTPSISNTDANQLLTPCELAASASLFSINWVSQCQVFGKRRPGTLGHTSTKRNAKRESAHDHGEKPKVYTGERETLERRVATKPKRRTENT